MLATGQRIKASVGVHAVSRGHGERSAAAQFAP